MTDAQILAIARVFDQEYSEYMGKSRGQFVSIETAAADMWAVLHNAVALEIKNMHGKRGELLFRNYAPAKQITRL